MTLSRMDEKIKLSIIKIIFKYYLGVLKKKLSLFLGFGT
jgi:hypothetical protein